MIAAKLENRIGRITLNRPEMHNAIDLKAMDDLRAVLALWATKDVRAVVLTGVGKSFCSGVALDDVESTDWSNSPLTVLCNALEEFPAPTICALNGSVFGGGIELAMSCDFRIGVQGMQMFLPAAKFGIHYDPVGIASIIQRLGAQCARRIFLLAEKFDDQALKDCGFLDHLLAPDQLEAATSKMSETLAALAPMAVRGMKQSIIEISRGTLDHGAATKRIVASLTSDDHAEGMAAKRENRPPVFWNK
ncbi:MAG: enoyl-CoA hydratase/isomerase family protein [Paracoccaceae bacterium]